MLNLLPDTKQIYPNREVILSGVENKRSLNFPNAMHLCSSSWYHSPVCPPPLQLGTQEDPRRHWKISQYTEGPFTIAFFKRNGAIIECFEDLCSIKLKSYRCRCLASAEPYCSSRQCQDDIVSLESTPSLILHYLPRQAETAARGLDERTWESK